MTDGRDYLVTVYCGYGKTYRAIHKVQPSFDAALAWVNDEVLGFPDPYKRATYRLDVAAGQIAQASLDRDGLSWAMKEGWCISHVPQVESILIQSKVTARASLGSTIAEGNMVDQQWVDAVDSMT